MSTNRRMTLIVTACIGLILPKLTVEAQMPSGLIAWWRGEGNVLDSTSTNNGTASGNLLYVTGRLGQAFSTEGTGPGTTVGVARITNNPALPPNPTNMTVAAWVRSAASPNTFRYIVNKSRTSGGASWALYSAAPVGTGGITPSGTGGGAGFFVNCTNASSSFTVLAPIADESKVWDGAWHFVVGTFDGTTARLYVDGLEVGAGTAVTPAQAGAGIVLTNNFQNGDIVLGDFNATTFGASHYNGALDEVMLFDNAISAQQVKDVFKSVETNLLAWWQAEGAPNDSVGTNDGVLVGNVYIATGRSGQSFNIMNGVVVIQDDAALRPASLTLGAQVRSAIPVTNKFIVSKSYTNSAPSYGFSTGPDGGLIFTITTAGGAVSSPVAGSAIWDGQYHAVFGTYDGTSVRLYVDGAQVGSGTAASGAIAYGTNQSNGELLFGDFQDTPGSQNFYGGSIDEVKIFGAALGAQEIADRTPAKPLAIVGKVNPDTKLVRVGSNVTFTVSTRQPIFVNNNANANLGLQFQWRKDGSDLAGLTTSSLTLALAQPNLAGQYDVRLSAPTVGYVSDGHFGSAFHVNAEIRVPNAPDLNCTNEVTVQVWVRAATAPGTFRYFFAKQFSPTQGSIGFYTGSSGTAAFFIKYGAANTQTSISSQMAATQTGLLWDGNWHQLTGVYASGDGFARLYIDGTEFVSTNGTATLSGTPIFYATNFPFLNGDITIGDVAQYNGSFHYQGDMDDIKLINRALTADEIMFSYTNLASTNFPGTVLWLQGENNLVDSASNHVALPSPPVTSLLSASASLSFFARLTNSIVMGGNFQGSVVDANGSTYIVKKSTDLTNWTPIVTNVVPFTFSDPVNGNPQSYYRAVSLP